MEEQKMSQRRTRAQLGLCREDSSSASKSDAFLFPEIRQIDVLEMPIIVPCSSTASCPTCSPRWAGLGSKCPSVLTQPLHADYDRQSQE